MYCKSNCYWMYKMYCCWINYRSQCILYASHFQNTIIWSKNDLYQNLRIPSLNENTSFLNYTTIQPAAYSNDPLVDTYIVLSMFYLMQCDVMLCNALWMKTSFVLVCSMYAMSVSGIGEGDASQKQQKLVGLAVGRSVTTIML